MFLACLSYLKCMSIMSIMSHECCQEFVHPQTATLREQDFAFAKPKHTHTKKKKAETSFVGLSRAHVVHLLTYSTRSTERLRSMLLRLVLSCASATRVYVGWRLEMQLRTGRRLRFQHGHPSESDMTFATRLETEKKKRRFRELSRTRHVSFAMDPSLSSIPFTNISRSFQFIYTIISLITVSNSLAVPLFFEKVFSCFRHEVTTLGRK